MPESRKKAGFLSVLAIEGALDEARIPFAVSVKMSELVASVGPLRTL
jgi:hypothetical protein